MTSQLCGRCGVTYDPQLVEHVCVAAKRPGLKNGSREEHSAAVKAGMRKTPWRCDCGTLWAAAKIACEVCEMVRPEEPRERPTLREREIDIIEAAISVAKNVEVKDADWVTMVKNLHTAVDDYHHELRRRAREDKL